MSGVMIRYGTGNNAVEFKGDELRNVKITQAVNPLSSQIEISTCDFTIDSKKGVEYSFQERQPLSVYFDDKLKATTFIKSAKRKAKNIWDIQSEDYIGLLDTITFSGGVYHGDNATDIITQILVYAGVPSSTKVTTQKQIWGRIPYTTCREALMQVAFATGWIVDTSESAVINVYELSDEISQNIPLKRILQGQSFEEETKITAVEVVAHLYEASTDLSGMEQVILYDASKNGAGRNIRLVYDKPMYWTYIYNGEMLESSANHAVFNINAGGTLIGYPYNYTTFKRTKANPSVTDTDIENVIVVQNATLVSLQNVDEVLERCYNHYISNKKIRLKIVEGKHEEEAETTNYAKYGEALYGSFIYGGQTVSTNDQPTKVGEMITCDTEYLGSLVGRITKQTFNLNGNIIIKDTEMWRGN